MNVGNMKKVEGSALVEETLKFWFTDQDHLRSPFPLYIRERLKTEAISNYLKWMDQLDEKGKEEMGEDFFRDKLEEVIFQTAIHFVKTEDEKLTLCYPFMPRIGDKVKASNDGEFSIVFERGLITKGDQKYLRIKLKEENSEKIWERMFELPA
jgi:hypothetical protein